MSVIAVGDITIDAFLTIHDANVYCRVNKKDCELCIAYGEKIQVDSCEFLLGGIACNVTVGLSRLGISTRLYAEIGDDEFAGKIIRELSYEQIDISHITKTPHASSSFAIGINFQKERTMFISHVKRKHDFHLENVSNSFVYLAGLGEEWKAAYKHVLDHVTKDTGKLVFSPGSAQLHEGYESIAEILKHTEILVLNKEEAIRISRPSATVPDLLKILQGYGPSIVAITDGKNGSYSIDKHGVIRSIGVYEATVVEKTGAGDAYTCGFLGAIVLGKSIEDAMRWGTYNAASVIGRVGAQAGLLKREDIEQREDIVVTIV